MQVAASAGSKPTRDAGRPPAHQVRLIANFAYGVWRAGGQGSPLAILLLLVFGHGAILASILFWAVAGSLAFGVAIAIASFAAMRGSVQARRALVILTGADFCLIVTLCLSPDVAPGGPFSPRILAMLAASTGIAVLNALVLWRAAPARTAGTPPPAARSIGAGPAGLGGI